MFDAFLPLTLLPIYTYIMTELFTFYHNNLDFSISFYLYPQ